ncbi:MAG: Flp pilus assembly complex ATPase component TadA [Intrasporangiaceae bacterium]|nr:Flp pilus assembly complex ATPase component TadA [Intrasporangiaceae bacterium]
MTPPVPDSSLAVGQRDDTTDGSGPTTDAVRSDSGSGTEHNGFAGPSAALADPRRRRRIGEVLLEAGIISESDLMNGLKDSFPGERLGHALIRLGIVDEGSIADAIASQLGLQRIDLTTERPTEEAIDRVPSKLAARHEVVPVRLDGDVLVLATADPSDVAAMDDVRLTARARKVVPVIATESAIEEARRRAYRTDAARGMMHDLEEQEEAPAEDDDLHDDLDADAQPVIKLVGTLLADAVVARASDIHIEPDRDGLAVRIRVDGMLKDRGHVPRSMSGQVVSRLKIMSRLDIAERRLPQDGRATVKVDDQEVDLRVSTMPTMHGETVVLRLLPKGAERVPISGLGLTDHAQAQFLGALERPQGLVLVTGPTGSGKTTTLYAGLEAVTDPTRNVITLEDPVEGELKGVNQTQIEPKIGFTFARGLRHVLRQDPDVVLVGEIRDHETASLAVEASFTGHLVLATLHTNNAPSSIARLVDLGADRFLVASSLLLVVAQRLARRLCPRCTEPEDPDEELLERAGLDAAKRRSTSFRDATFRTAPGCAYCDHTGAVGRIAISEILPMISEMRDLIIEGAAEGAMTKLAAAGGMVSLREDAVARAMQGDISLHEAVRVTPDP